ncbi:MAG TPA: ribosomal protein S18-alanine N-acetyltransferase [Burkholderiales bacterium]|nr:ribosomal protein S18-alanine N-acetyltransferase [Burkholderiales bacterium]
MSAIPVPGLAVEVMHEADLAEVLAIERSVYEFPWTAGNFRDSLRAGYHCRIGLLQGTLTGYFIMMVAAGEAHLLNLSVALHLQRQGHGGMLLRAALQLARKSGARLFYLEVRPSNALGRALYARNGFREIGVRKNYYPAANGREDALVLSVDL